MRTAILFSALFLVIALHLPLLAIAQTQIIAKAQAQPQIQAYLQAQRLVLPSSGLELAALTPASMSSTPSSFAELAAIVSNPCRVAATPNTSSSDTGDGTGQLQASCLPTPNPYTRFLNTTTPAPLTPGQKAHLALHNIKDPGNLATIFGTAAYTIATDSHTAYGPGWKGFGSNSGYSLLQDATGNFFGTFLIPSVFGEDPHYHRMPHAAFPHRVVHALSRTIIAQSDYGRNMPNFATLLTNPICAEISNLYVPGINGNGPSTVARIMTGFATDPIDNLITEFLPDVAKHIQIHVIFVQRILNPVAADQYSLP